MNRSLIKITGVDAAKFLQNLVTNDVCSENKVIYAMMLSPQGRFLFDMFIIKTDDSFLLDVFDGTKELLMKKLGMYKINLKVTIDGLCEEDISYKDPRSELLGHGSSYLEDKYEYAIPDGGIDLLYDKAMPQEYGAEELNAISYTKGCYIGQEVISRTKYQGEVRKKIYKITSDSDLSDIPHGTEITSDAKKIGIFCSGHKTNGIALIREELYSQKAIADQHEIQLTVPIWRGG